jgi:hypothetical protein
MPSNRTTSQEERRMITFDAIAHDGTRERLRFETQAEADAAADQYREAATASTGSLGARASSAGSASPKTDALDLPPLPRAAPAAGARGHGRAMVLSEDGDDR